MKDGFGIKCASKPCILVVRDFFLLGTRALRVPQYKPQQYCTDLLVSVRTTHRSDSGMFPLYKVYGAYFPTCNNALKTGQGHTSTIAKSIMQRRRMTSIVWWKILAISHKIFHCIHVCQLFKEKKMLYTNKYKQQFLKKWRSN